jgi:hypothetical protein
MDQVYKHTLTYTTLLTLKIKGNTSTMTCIDDTVEVSYFHENLALIARRSVVLGYILLYNWGLRFVNNTPVHGEEMH